MPDGSVIISASIARSPQVVADQLVLGLVTGGLLGPGLAIERRESLTISFAKASGILQRLPDRGLIELQMAESGETHMVCRLWCGGMRLRGLLHAGAAGAAVVAIAAVPLGASGYLAAAAGLAAAVLWAVVGGRRDRRWLAGRVEAFVRNTNYLRTV